MPLKMFQDEQPQPNLLPMIDVVFQLVLFLMLGAQFQEEERNINVKVPQSAAAQLLPLTEVRKKIVNVDRQGHIMLENHDVLPSELMSSLAAAHAQYSDLSVIVRGDEESIYHHVTDVLTICRQAGIENISIAVRFQDKKGSVN